MKLSRRGLFGTALGGAACASVSGALGANAKRPNILYVIQEDIGPQMACYGEPLVRTPHLDRFATQGVRFTNVYTSGPVCSASLSALMTGCYQARIGAHQHRTWQWNKKALAPAVRHMCQWLR